MVRVGRKTRAGRPTIERDVFDLEFSYDSFAVMSKTENTKLFCAFEIAVGLVKHAEKNYPTKMNYPRAVHV